MTITQTITPFPEPVPQRSDPDNFPARADATLGHLETFVDEENIAIGQINDTQDQINTLETSASQSASSSANSAVAANNSASAAAASATLAGYQGDWLIGTTYSKGQTVTKDGVIFVSKTDSNTGNDPLTDSTNWSTTLPGRLFIRRYF